MVKRVKFKVVEGLVFNKPSVKTPEARGPFTAQKTYPLPNPSTILGAILTALEFNKPLDWNNLNEVEKDLKKHKIDLYGPYLEINGEIYVRYFENIVKLDDLRKKINEIKKLDKNFETALKLYLKRKRKIIELKSYSNRISRIGIALEDNKKINKDGYLYSQEILFLDDKNIYKDVYIVVENLETPEDLGKINNKIVRLGGEGRITKIVLDEGELNKDGNSDYIMLISSAIIEINKDLNNKDIFDLINKNLSKYNVELIHGKIEYMSLGWDLNKEKLKPFYLFLSPGSILKIKGKNNNYKIGELKRAGFGSFVYI